MFKIENVYCDDKKLGDVLRALTGLTRGQPVAVPMTNVEEGGIGGPKAKTNGKLVTMLAEHMVKSKLESIRPKEVGAWLAKIGMSKQSASYVARMAVSEGVIRKTGQSSQTVYHLVNKGGK
jgi:hypothetical protein